MLDALQKGYIAARVGEALTNYQFSDAPLAEAPDLKRPSEPPANGLFFDDREFWTRLL